MIMAFKKFNEYLNEKGKVEENPPKMPSKKIKVKKNKNALGHHGNKKLVYEPKTEPLQNKSPEWHKEKEDGPNLPKPSKPTKVGPTSQVSKVSEWIHKTKGMSLSEFAKNIHEEKNVEIDYSKIRSVQDLLAVAVSAMKNNPRLIENIVREIKRSNLSEAVLIEILKDKNLYESVAGPIGFEKLYDGEPESEDEVDSEDASDEMEGDGEEYSDDSEDSEDSEDGEEYISDDSEDSEEEDDSEDSEEEDDSDDYEDSDNYDDSEDSDSEESDDSEEESEEDYEDSEEGESEDEESEESEESEEDYEDSDNYDDSDESEEDYGGDEEESDEDEDYFGKFGKYNR
jgi:hypothetical protein